MKTPASVEKLIAVIVRDRENAGVELLSEFEAIASRDYRRQIAAFFSRREGRRIVKILMDAIPGLNQSAFDSTDTAYLRRIVTQTGAEFRPVALPKESRNLRGFYLPKGTFGNRKPAVYVNTNHHRIAVAAATLHELGHHVVETRISPVPRPAAVAFEGDYESHLRDPLELIADATVTLAAYPHDVARKRFVARPRTPEEAALSSMVSNAYDYLKNQWGWEFNNSLPKDLNLHYLAGVIHFAKLRHAILAEFGL